MTNRKFFSITCGLVCAFALAGLAGCSSIKSVFGTSRIDYKSAGQKSAPKLEVPPDLVQMQGDERYSIPEGGSGAVTASGYGQTAAPAPNTVALNAISDMHIERDGNQRWLVVKETPESLWPKVRAFWQKNGFKIDADLPQAGVMEAERVPQDRAPKKGWSRFFGSSHPAEGRDRFLTRFERGADNSTTEITISSRAPAGPQTESEPQAAPPSDLNRDAEFLSRLMVSLGGKDAQPGSATVNAAEQPEHAKLIAEPGNQHIEIDEGFDRTWRRVGLALDRAGFTVEDRDRSQGIFYVRYLDLGPNADKGSEEPGFFARVFAGRRTKTAQRYRIVVKETGDSVSRVTVLNSDGAPEHSSTGERILSVLTEQLK